MAHTDQRITTHNVLFARRGALGRARWLVATALLCGVLAAKPRTAAAQLPNLVEVSAQYSPAAGLDSPELTQEEIWSYQVMLNVPIRLPGGRFLIPGVAYRADSIAQRSMSAASTQHTTFHAPELSALFVQLLPGRWSASIRASGSIAGRFETVDRHMIRYGALALASRSFSDRFVIGGGALASGGFGPVRVLPAVSLRWKPSDEVQVEVFVPAFASVRYTEANRVEFGPRVELAGMTYAIRDADIAKRWPCATQPADDPATSVDETMPSPDACFDHATYTVASAGMVAGVRLTSTVWLTAFGGVSFYRHAEQQGRGGDAIPKGSQDLPRALFLRTSLAWRLPGT